MSDAYARSEALNHAVELHEKAVANGCALDAAGVVQDAGTMLAFLHPTIDTKTEETEMTEREAYERQAASLRGDLNTALSERDTERERTAMLEQEVNRLQLQNRDKDIVRDTLRQELAAAKQLVLSAEAERDLAFSDRQTAVQEAWDVKKLSGQVGEHPVAATVHPITATAHPITAIAHPAPATAQAAQAARTVQPEGVALAVAIPASPAIQNDTGDTGDGGAEPSSRTEFARGAQYPQGSTIPEGTTFFWEDAEGKTGARGVATRDLLIGANTPADTRYYMAMRF